MIKFKKTYPRIIFTAEKNADISELRHGLSGIGIYVHSADFSSAKELLPDADVVVVYSPRYSSPATAFLNYVDDKSADTKIIYIGQAADVRYNEKIDVVPPITSAVISELLRVLKETFVFDPAYAEDNEIICELSKPPQVYYNGIKLLLSRSEAKIVHFLLTLEPRLLAPKETIGEYLALAPGAVPVHIHNINDKAMKSYHDKLVFSRSSRGYFVY